MLNKAMIVVKYVKKMLSRKSVQESNGTSNVSDGLHWKFDDILTTKLYDNVKNKKVFLGEVEGT